MTSLLRCLVGVLLIGVAASFCAYSDPVVQTPLGRIQGQYQTSRGGMRYMAFQGVPYAQPPVGNAAFQPPQPLTPWNGIKLAKENGPWCLQYNLYDLEAKVVGKQDCLYLSVATRNPYGRAPVIVHFHGGGFTSGNGANITGPGYFMDHDVVIVDVNYRLGIYGFLSFEDKDMPGNVGMKDQVQALRWVQQNIASFGGDPNQVTLMGESAGGGSVSLHTLSPLSKGLYHKAIAESGSSYGLWCVTPEGHARKLAMKLLEHLNCNYTTTKAAVECINRHDPSYVASQMENYRQWQVDPIFNFAPVLEPAGPSAFLTGPVSLWKHNPVPLLTGITSAEGLLRTQYFYHNKLDFKWFTQNFDQLAPITGIYFASAPNPDEVTRAIKKFYFPKGEITANDWVNLTTMISDAYFTTALIDAANRHSGDVYFYYFDYVGEKSFFGNRGQRNESLIFGAQHLDEVIYLWHTKQFEGLKGRDLELSRRLVRIWVDFARTGNPGPGWEKWNPARKNYLWINKNGFQMKEGLAAERYNFWKSINYRGNYRQ